MKLFITLFDLYGTTNRPKTRAELLQARKNLQGVSGGSGRARRQRQRRLAKGKKKDFKKKLATARRSFEEMKSYSHEQLAIDLGVTTLNPVVDNVYNPTAVTHMISSTGLPLTSKIFPMWSFYNPLVGFSDHSMIGSKRINKFLKCKMVFIPPSIPQVDNPRYYLISAWVTNPVNLTEFTAPHKNSFTRANLIQHILKSVQKDFDENGQREFVNFNPVETKHYKIVSYRRINFDKNSEAVAPTVIPGSSAAGGQQVEHRVGKNSRSNHTFTWKLNQSKNTKYTEGDVAQLGAPVPFYYPNNSWLPVVIYYSPDAGTPDTASGAPVRTGPENNPSVYFNNQTWFTG